MSYRSRDDLTTLVLALVVGAGAGLGAIAFRWLIERFTDLFTGSAETGIGGVVGNGHLPGLGVWAVLLAPVVGGLVYGPLVRRFAPEARGHGVPEVMYAVARRGGRIAPQVAVVKALASALCIGSGGSVGREGPIVQIGSALGSSLGGLFRVSEERRRLMVACGAAGGIAATFNAPLAGVFFAMELILTDFAARSFGMVVVSSVTASVLARGVLGDDRFLTLPSFRVDHLATYPLIALLGVLAGVVGVVFSRVLYAVEDGCDWAWRGPEWARPAVGGLLLGGLLLAVPQMYGVGYPVLGAAVAGHYAVGFLLVLLVASMVATSLTIGIGGSGGVFAPSLFIGAALGAAFGQSVHALVPDQPAGIYALIGMAAVFAGAARAPITAVVILFELTGEYSLILPMMLAVVLATGVAQLITRETIYTLKLLRRGVDLLAPAADGVLEQTTVRAVMSPVSEAVPLETTVRSLGSLRRPVCVLEERGRFAGLVTPEAVLEALAEDEHDPTVRDLVERAPQVAPDQSLAAAFATLHENAEHGVAVVDHDGLLVGWLDAADLLPVLAGPQPPSPAISVIEETVRSGGSPGNGGRRPRST